MTKERILPDPNGMIHVPDAPGLGLTVDTEKLRPYLVDVEINVNGKTIYKTPAL